MTAARRAHALFLIVILFCVPALTRAMQSPDSARSSAPAFSFRKSVDGPRERISVSPDLAPLAMVAVSQTAVPQMSPRRPLADRQVPVSPPPASPSLLRAPPATRLA